MARTFALTILALLPLAASAQWKERFRHSIGVGAHVLPVSRSASAAFGLCYDPLFSIIERWTDFSISGAMPVTLGFHPSLPALPKAFFYAHLPLMAEAGIGHFSTKRFHNDIGMGIGGGYGFQVAGMAIGHGPAATLAVRFWASRVSLSLRYIYQHRLAGSGGYDAHAVSLGVNLGSFYKQLRRDNAHLKWQNVR